MIKCSFKIPIKSWKFKDDIWDYMTLESWFTCRGRSCKHFKGFEDDLSTKLNRISSRGKDFTSIWFSKIEGSQDFTIEYYTSNETISLLEFLNLIYKDLFPIFNNVESMGELLVFSDNYFDKNTLKIEFTDESFN